VSYIFIFWCHPNSLYANIYINVFESYSYSALFGLYVWNSCMYVCIVNMYIFLFLSSFTMLMFTMELLDWIVISSLLVIFISPTAISFSSYVKDEKLSILRIKMGKGLVFFTLMIFMSSRSCLNLAKELVIDTDLLGWYLFILSYLRSVKISKLFVSLSLTSLHKAYLSFVHCA